MIVFFLYLYYIIIITLQKKKQIMDNELNAHTRIASGINTSLTCLGKGSLCSTLSRESNHLFCAPGIYIELGHRSTSQGNYLILNEDEERSMF